MKFISATQTCITKYFIPILLWALVWANLNTGYWGLKNWNGINAKVYALRSAIPYLLIGIGILVYCLQNKQFRTGKNPVWWLMIYGYIALFSSLFSPNIWSSFYFGIAFLTAIFIPAAFFCQQQKMTTNLILPENALMYSTWMILGIFLIGLVLVFGKELVESKEILNTAKKLNPELQIRSSGLSRFFGVFGVVTFIWILQCKSWWRYFWFPIFFYCAFIVYQAQSRGAMLAFGVSIVVALLLSRVKWAVILLSFLAISSTIAFSSIVIPKLENTVIKQFRRGNTNEQLVEMSGRIHAYQAGLQQISQNPLVGRGNWSDRMTIGEHVHNSYLQAAMNAGLIGLLPYLSSWLAGGLLILHIYPRRQQLTLEQNILFLQSIGVITFFLIRSIPETTTASFSADLLIMVPAYYFLCATYYRLKEVPNENITSN